MLIMKSWLSCGEFVVFGRKIFCLEEFGDGVLGVGIW